MTTSSDDEWVMEFDHNRLTILGRNEKERLTRTITTTTKTLDAPLAINNEAVHPWGRE